MNSYTPRTAETLGVDSLLFNRYRISVGALFAVGFAFLLLSPASVSAGTLKSEITQTVDECESLSNWEPGGAQISLEDSTDCVKEGRGSIKFVFPIDHTEVESWQCATRKSLSLAVPKEIIFWVKPDAPYLSPQIMDSDGTQVAIDINDLKVGEWNQVSVEVDSMVVINPGEDGVMTNMNNLIFAVHPNKSGFGDSKKYVYYIDDIRMIPLEEKATK
jgi:hypothetical protein